MAEARRRHRLEISRGDVVINSTPGDNGKPRPALALQSDLFNPTHPSIVICPITSQLGNAPSFRLPLRPSPGNGLKTESQVMVDKVTSVRQDHIGKRAGRISEAEAAEVDRALTLWLDLGSH